LSGRGDDEALPLTLIVFGDADGMAQPLMSSAV
jgi:hypothetical protein